MIIDISKPDRTLVDKFKSVFQRGISKTIFGIKKDVRRHIFKESLKARRLIMPWIARTFMQPSTGVPNFSRFLQYESQLEWPELAPSTIKKKGHGGFWVKSGKMRSQFSRRKTSSLSAPIINEGQSSPSSRYFAKHDTIYLSIWGDLDFDIGTTDESFAGELVSRGILATGHLEKLIHPDGKNIPERPLMLPAFRIFTHIIMRDRINRYLRSQGFRIGT